MQEDVQTQNMEGIKIKVDQILCIIQTKSDNNLTKNFNKICEYGTFEMFAYILSISQQSSNNNELAQSILEILMNFSELDKLSES